MINRYLLTASIGNGCSDLTSFDKALLNSKIGNYNIVKVSSILPVKAIETEKVGIVEGNVLFTAFSHITSNKIGMELTASIAIGIPKDNNKVGVIMELACGEPKEKAEQTIIEMVKEAMSNRGNEIAEILIKSSSVEVDSSGRYFTAFSAVAMWEE